MRHSFLRVIVSQILCNRENRFMIRCVRRTHLSAHTVKTMKDVRSVLDKWMEFPEGYVETPPDRSHLLGYLVNSQDALPHRSIKDSFTSVIIPLSTELRLQHRYATVTGKLRMGRIIEDMDFFAVFIALKHIKNPRWEEGKPSPYVIVTASVDNIEFTPEKPPVDTDVKLTGKIVFATKSSMDVKITLERKTADGWEPMTNAVFVMVARNATLSGPAIVNKLVPDGHDEENEVKEALARRERKKEADQASVLNTHPNHEEQKLIHDVFMKSVDQNDIGLNRRVLPEGCNWMEDSRLSTCIFPHPENKNHHNTVFGGYIMRLALQLAFMTAYKYSSRKPSLRYVTNITFKKPVYLDQFMEIKSQVVYTQGIYMQIGIFIETQNLSTKVINTTHSLYVTYQVDGPVKSIIPKTYHETMLWLEALRAFQMTSL